MPIESVSTSRADLTLSIVAAFPVSRLVLWDAYLDPRQVERFWGPPAYPATFVRHDGFVGGRSTYAMTGPDSQVSAGYWDWLSVERPSCFQVRDGFLDGEGNADPNLPSVEMTVRFTDGQTDSGLTLTSRFDSAADLGFLLGLGMKEGLTSALRQLDDLLANVSGFGKGAPTELELIGQRQARVSRVLRGERELVWAAMTDPGLLKQWQLAPEGWEMRVCQVSQVPGFPIRLEYQSQRNGESFGFLGSTVQVIPGFRWVTTKRFFSPADPLGEESPETLNELTLTGCNGGTLATLVMTFPSEKDRTEMIATGMVSDMETDYRHLEQRVLGRQR